MFWRTRMVSLSAPSSEREEKFRNCLIRKMKELQSIETRGIAHLQRGVTSQNTLNLLHNFKDIPAWATQNVCHVVWNFYLACIIQHSAASQTGVWPCQCCSICNSSIFTTMISTALLTHILQMFLRQCNCRL